MKKYIKEQKPSLKFQDLEKEYWFLRWKIIILFIIFLVLILILELYVLGLCFSSIQHSSLTISIFQSIVNIIAGAVTVAIARSNTVTGFDPDNKMAQKLIDSISQLQDQDNHNNSTQNHYHNTNMNPSESTPLVLLSESESTKKKQDKP